jgi:hypothetical protein
VKLRTSHLSLVIAFLAALCIGLAAGVLAPEEIVTPVCAQQSGCPQMNVGGNTSLTWPAGATVKVFFDSSVSPDRMDIYKQALNNWSAGNGQGVTFVFEVETGQAQYSMSVTDAIPNGDNSLRGQVVWQGWDGNGVLQYVDIQMNPNVTDSTALLNAMSHEIAHNFGLNHATTVSNQTASSLYNSNNGLNDTSTGAPGPTPCDKQTMNSIYAGGGVKYVAPTIGGSGGDGGYDPGYYYYYDYNYCTPYYWVYYESYDGGRTWNEVDSWYAGCW